MLPRDELRLLAGEEGDGLFSRDGTELKVCETNLGHAHPALAGVFDYCEHGAEDVERGLTGDGLP